MNFLKRLLGVEQKDAIIQQQQETLCRVFENNRKIAEMGIGKDKYKKQIELLKQRLETQEKLHAEEIKKIEKALEGTIDKQYNRIKELESQLIAKDFDGKNSGKFYVYNPDAGKPKKIYKNYHEALKDAVDVAQISGDEVHVLKILTSINVDVKDETVQGKEEEIPY